MVNELREGSRVQVAHQGGVRDQIHEAHAAHERQVGDARAGGAVLAQAQAQDSGVHLTAVGVDGQVLERLEVAGEIQK